MKSFLTLAFALIALAGCNKEDAIPGMNPEVTGVPTYGAFSINVKATATTRDGDSNADTVELKIDSVRLFVFSGGVLENLGDIVVNPDTHKGATALLTTTGEKEIYAVANPRADMTLALGTTLADFKKLAVAAASTDIAASGKFVMIGKTTTTLLTPKTQEQALANPIPISVSRGAAKVQMRYKDGDVIVNGSLKGTFTDPKYLLAQTNTKMFLPREGYELTPKGATAEQTAATPAGSTYSHLAAIPADMTGAKIATGDWDNTFANSCYTAENVNEKPVSGNTTFVLVQLKYTPATSEITGGALVDGTFYAACDKTTHRCTTIYATKDACDAAVVLGTNLETKTYTGGLVYYRVNLRDITKTTLQEKYCVLRNSYYKVNITQINSLGGDKTTDPDVIAPSGTNPLETDSYISAEITVEPWNAIVMNEPLG